jgi:hypothetical protein
MENYQIVLFRNRIKQKVLIKYKNRNTCFQKYKNLLNDNNVKFEIKYENGQPVNYELLLICENCDYNKSLFQSDEIGRNVELKTNNSNYKILESNIYNLNEKFTDYQTKKRITIDQLISLYFKNKSLKNVFSLNNKLFIQQDETINCFVLKNNSDSERLLETILYLSENSDVINIIYMKYRETIDKKQIYDTLNNYGFSKNFLYRQYVNYPSKKQK